MTVEAAGLRGSVMRNNKSSLPSLIDESLLKTSPFFLGLRVDKYMPEVVHL